ncbi:MAG: flagellar hook-associated protein FlgK [Treponema sp. CETP13]|nr:MAG: flagellar hook-associated protein FlgK [Treponema sp. CETP13]
MGSTFGTIEMGKRSLMATNQQLATTGHNISNADTEGYSRQRVTLSAMDPLYRADLSREERAGQIGQGVTVESVTRVRDELLDTRIVAQANEKSYWSTRDDYCTMLESIYNEPEDISIRSNMDKFWESWQELSTYPDSKAARQAVITRGETLVNSVKQRFTSLSGIGTMLNGDIEGTVSEVNSYAKQIASLNNQIVESEGLGDNPNDLYDKRDLLTDKLSELINIKVDHRDPDEFMIHVGGKILVQGDQNRSFDLEKMSDNNGYSKVVWADTGDDATDITGGQLGALITLRDDDVRSEMQSLNTMSMNFADLVNDIHRNSVGANNTTGLDFFVEEPFVTNAQGNFDRNGDGVEDSSYIFRMTGGNKLDLQAETGLEGVMTLSSDTGTVDISYGPADTVETIINRINDSSSDVKAYLDRNSNLVLKATTAKSMENPDFVIRHVEDSGYFLSGYSGLLAGRGAENAYDFGTANAVESLASNNAGYAVAPVLNPSGYMEVNSLIKSDVQSVAASKPNSYGMAEAGDGSAAVEIAALRNSNIMIGNSKTFDDYFADTVTKIGLKGEEAQINLESQTAVMEDLTNLRDSISGVNMDEELADMLKFQHGYNAAAKFISVMDELLDTVINGMGV